MAENTPPTPIQPAETIGQRLSHACTACREPVGLHSLRSLLMCLYGGRQTTDGGLFCEADADQIIDRMRKRLR